MFNIHYDVCIFLTFQSWDSSSYISVILFVIALWSETVIYVITTSEIILSLLYAHQYGQLYKCSLHLFEKNVCSITVRCNVLYLLIWSNLYIALFKSTVSSLPQFFSLLSALTLSITEIVVLKTFQFYGRLWISLSNSVTFCIVYFKVMIYEHTEFDFYIFLKV